MNPISRSLAPLATVAIVLLGASCASDGGPTDPTSDSVTALLSVDPPGGATGIPVDRPVVIEFDHPMAPGMEAYADVHEGDLAAPPLAGTWTWSADRTRLTFGPAAPFRPNTVYIVHLGGGMADSEGMPVDFREHGSPHMGGEWATGDMMNEGWSGGPGMGGGMGGMGGPGTWSGQPYQGHMGPGWRQADGAYGMVFAFRTAG